MNPAKISALVGLALFVSGCSDKSTGDTAPVGDDTGVEDSGNAGPVDADADGFTEDEDCDDTDKSVHPGAEETCDGLDQDCDGQVDEAAVDASTFYADLDGDGFGDGDAPMQACELEDGLVADVSDCDDDDDAVHPEATELTCDGVDNDCDSSIDINRVPTDHPSLQDAVDILGDGSEICVEPGTYAEQLDLSGRTLTFTGQGGTASTVLDIGTSSPMMTLVGESETYDDGMVTFSGFTITGGDLSADGSDLEGGFAHVQGSTLALSDIVFTGHEGEMTNGGVLSGMLVWADTSSVSLTDVLVNDVAFELGRGSASYDSATGIMVRVASGELEFDGVTVSGVNVTADASRQDCKVSGIFLGATDGAAVTGSSLDFSSNSLDMVCLDRAYGEGLAVYADNATTELIDTRITGNLVNIEGEYQGYMNGFVTLYGGEGGWSALEISDNDLSTLSERSSNIYGGVHTEFMDFSQVSIRSNTLEARAVDGTSTGDLSGMLIVAAGDVDHLDVRGNVGVGDASVSALVAVQCQECQESTTSLSNFIIAGNTVEAPEIFSGPLAADAEIGSVQVRNGDIVGNLYTGSTPYGVGGVNVYGNVEGDLVTLVNVQIVDNSIDGGGELPAVYNGSDPKFASVTYCNLVSDDGETSLGDISGTDGNISQAPLYADVSSSDPSAWDLTLQSGSPAVDAGDTAHTDDDGSRSDMGAYGGADGTSW